MNRHYQRISQFSAIAFLAIASTAISPVSAQQPQLGDADRLRPAQGQPISPTNTDQFSIERDLPNSNLKIQNINFDVEEIQPVIPGNYNASPQKVNRSGTFSSDPLNAIQIFQESGTSRSDK
ncbi:MULTISPECIES: hypothetical protein [Pseudanabaena]|uniref:hypothetical protein n=1 Tax=Pseudanabaena TaxID=1152 RepID=UPI002479D504|nr:MULTISPECIES: hypothetical protein [Pseudanabaena]MEA5488514.1 hypothetical protein [Pseudanabaena sp. CCNP1317]WGS71914.1 hypothetical protein OA858_19760 [Pseudanabaena galeata CCNP1313]